jgi:hypothetical protein
MPKNVSCYIAKMLRDHPGSINKWIKKLKPEALVEALKVTSKEIHAWEEEGQRAEEELRKEINERWDKLTSYERNGAECWNELCGMQKKYWELCAELYPALDEELNIEAFISEEFREAFREEPGAAKSARRDGKYDNQKQDEGGDQNNSLHNSRRDCG